MPFVYKYRVWCTTDNKYEYVWGTAVPTTCPINTGHTIDTNKTTVVDSAGGEAPVTERGFPKITVEPPQHSRSDFISPNFCDKTTWHVPALPIANETLSDSGDLTTWNSVSSYWIDVMHGKITDERDLRATYTPVITVNDVAKVENSPGLTDNDYSINYVTGSVIFNAALTGGDVVKATSYYKENGSLFIVAPSAGKLLRLTKAEIQFSTNMELTDTAIFEPYGYVDVFAPQLLDTADPPGPYPSGTKIPLGQKRVYQTMQDYVNEAQESFPEIPQIGGSGWRGSKGSIQIFSWPYQNRGTLDLVSSAGMEVRVQLESNIPFGGDVAVVTIYGISEDE